MAGMTTSSGSVQAARRLLLVHAHPDDETINTGATMARYTAEGAQVTLVTCTRGERGEVIPERLSHLTESKDVTGAALGDHRVGELAAAMTALGVTDHRFLGDPHSPGRTAAKVTAAGGVLFRDSGMDYDQDGAVVPSPDSPPGAFALANVDTAAGFLAELIRQVRPQVVISYEPGGGYGHPDHVQAHVITMRAVELAAETGWLVPKVYWIVMPQSLARATLGALAAAEGESYQGPAPAGRLPSMVVPDDQVTTAIDAIAFTADKVAALRAHETQVSVTTAGTFYSLSNGVRSPIIGLEFYRLVRGDPAGGRDDLGRETDLFAGL